MMSLLAVAAGGAIGSLCRYGVGNLVSFPFGTISVNIVGSFLIGVLFTTVQDNQTRLLLITGVLGGFTTFSTFSLEALILWQQGQTLYAVLYVLASVCVSIAAVFSGYYLGKFL